MKAIIFERTGMGDPSCPLCRFNSKIPSHLFHECPTSRVVAFGSKWSLKLDTLDSNNAQELVRWCVSPSHQLFSNLGGKEYTFLLLATFLYIIWELQNDAFFENKRSIAQATAWESLVEEFNQVALTKDTKNLPHREVIWQPPQSGKICINIDVPCSSETSGIAIIAKEDKRAIRFLLPRPYLRLEPR